MIITKEMKYLNLPIRHLAERKKLYFYEGNELILDLDVQLDFEKPDCVFPYYIGGFLGRDIEIRNADGEVLTYSEDCTTIPVDEIRPKIHFTAGYGLINDPNGLVFYEGKYHLFFQHNPVGNIKANMHWGHAVSEDLVSWTQLNTVLVPDNMGDMWSGSAIVDKKNLLGLNTPEHEALVLFYTAAAGQREVNADKVSTQCMAYSTDGGYTFKKYENNPVVSHIKNINRDPKVVYDPQNDMYIMALYLDGAEYAILKSSNLTDWTMLNSFVLDGSRECPDMFLIDDSKEKIWMFTGANDCCFTGQLDINKGFVNIRKLGQYGYGWTYAAQTWSNIEDRIVRIDIHKERDIYAKHFNSTMSVPYELCLKDGIPCVKPVVEIDKLISPYCKEENIPLSGYSKMLPSCETDVRLVLSGVKDKVVINLFENDITVDFENENIVCGEVDMPLHINDGKAELRIITDSICLEIFSADRYYGGFKVVNADKEKTVSFSGDGRIDRLEIGLY